MEARNVKEKCMLYDTVGIYTPPFGVSMPVPDGWFLNYAALSAANEIPFFNVRNRSAGLMWCNQDKRDQLAWPFLIQSIGIEWWALSMSSAPSWSTDQTFSPEDHASHVFATDVPRHCGVTLQVQQDERLKAFSYFCQPGYGVFGDGYGRSAPSALGAGNDNGWDHILNVVSQGQPLLNNRFHFPIALEVPRNATLNVRLTINEYGRQMLAVLPWLTTWFGASYDVTDSLVWQQFSGIRVTLEGYRLVQQRGQYHR